MPYQDTIEKLIEAGPFVLTVFAFLILAIVLLGMVLIISRMFRAFVDLQRSTNEQTALTREAITKIDEKVLGVGTAVARVHEAAIDNRIEIKRLAALIVNRFDSSDQKMGQIHNMLTDNLLPIMGRLDIMSSTIMELEGQVINAYQNIVNELNKKDEGKELHEEISALAHNLESTPIPNTGSGQ